MQNVNNMHTQERRPCKSWCLVRSPLMWVWTWPRTFLRPTLLQRRFYFSFHQLTKLVFLKCLWKEQQEEEWTEPSPWECWLCYAELTLLLLLRFLVLSDEVVYGVSAGKPWGSGHYQRTMLIHQQLGALEPIRVSIPQKALLCIFANCKCPPL